MTLCNIYIAYKYIIFNLKPQHRLRRFRQNKLRELRVCVNWLKKVVIFKVSHYCHGLEVGLLECSFNICIYIKSLYAYSLYENSLYIDFEKLCKSTIIMHEQRSAQVHRPV